MNKENADVWPICRRLLGGCCGYRCCYQTLSALIGLPIETLTVLKTMLLCVCAFKNKCTTELEEGWS